MECKCLGCYYGLSQHIPSVRNGNDYSLVAKQDEEEIQNLLCKTPITCNGIDCGFGNLYLLSVCNCRNATIYLFPVLTAEQYNKILHSFHLVQITIFLVIVICTLIAFQCIAVITKLEIAVS